MNKIISICFVFCCFYANATNYYVSQPNGSNSNDGLTPETPFRTIQHAQEITQPGDTVFIMNGIYTNPVPNSDVVTINVSGNEENWITYKNYEGHHPIIQMNENNWQGIRIEGADYIIIDGIKIIGNNDNISLEYAISEQNNLFNSSTSGNGIGVVYEYANPENKPHHIVIRNCEISKCGGGGIFVYNSDYVTIENNIVKECAWYSPYNNSAITLYQNWNSDSSTEIKNIITRNTCYRNECFIPNIFGSEETIIGGSGIVIDDSRNTQSGSTLGVYLGKTNITNNVVFDNGGRGIHSYTSDNLIIANNTLYKNCKSPDIQDGEITTYLSSNVVAVNNISFPDADISPIHLFDTTETVVSHNLWAANSGIANPQGTNFQTGNPDFVSESNNIHEADFRLLISSIAIENGTTNFAPLVDKDGIERVENPDIGAYEYVENLSNSDFTKNNLVVYPNPAKNIITIELPEQNNASFEGTIFNTMGQSVKTFNAMDNKINLNIEDLSSGIYFISLSKDTTNAFKLIKI